MSSVPNFWISAETGENMLRGVDYYDPDMGQYVNDPDNPARLPPEYIIEILQSNAIARLGFNDLYTTTAWTPPEAERLEMIKRNASSLMQDPQVVDDKFMRRQNTAGIYTTGPNGGRGWG